MCRAQRPLALTCIFKVIQPWVSKKIAKMWHILLCPLYSMYKSGWILPYLAKIVTSMRGCIDRSKFKAPQVRFLRSHHWSTISSLHLYLNGDSVYKRVAVLGGQLHQTYCLQICHFSRGGWVISLSPGNAICHWPWSIVIEVLVASWESAMNL